VARKILQVKPPKVGKGYVKVPPKENKTTEQPAKTGGVKRKATTDAEAKSTKKQKKGRRRRKCK